MTVNAKDMDDSVSTRIQLASDAALASIGRNLLVYQRIEMNLKQIEINSRPISIDATTTVEQLHEQKRRTRSEVGKYTLGQVLRTALRFEGDPGNPAFDAASGDSSMLTLSFPVVLNDTQATRDWFENVKTVIDARNRQAHNFLDDFNLETLEDCEKARLHLDDAYEKAVSFFHFTRSVLTQRQQLWTTGFLADLPEQLDQGLTCAFFAGALQEASTRLCRADGWCLFATAAHAVRKSDPDLVAEWLSCGKHKTIRSAAEATQAFRWIEEPTKKGSRLLFRWHGE